MEWYLRKEDGSQFGPEPLDALQRWAEEGRIAPEDRVSRDGQAWMRAADLKDLDMEWSVELTDGSRFGPVHILALREPLRAGDVLFHSRIYRASERRGSMLGDLLFEALANRNENLRQRLESLAAGGTEEAAAAEPIDADREADDTEAREAATPGDGGEEPDVPTSGGAGLEEEPEDRPRAAQLEQPAVSWSEATRQSDRLSHEAQKWKQLYEQERDQAREREQALQQRFDELRQSESSARSSLDTVTTRLHQLEKGYEMLQHSVGGSTADEGESSALAGEQVAALIEAYNEMARHHEVLLGRHTERGRELETLMEERALVESNAAERVRLIEERIEREQREADGARRKLAEIESAYLELLRSYREINDRFIRFRHRAREEERTPPRPPAKKTPPEEPSEPAGEAAPGRRF